MAKELDKDTVSHPFYSTYTATKEAAEGFGDCRTGVCKVKLQRTLHY